MYAEANAAQGSVAPRHTQNLQANSGQCEEKEEEEEKMRSAGHPGCIM